MTLLILNIFLVGRKIPTTTPTTSNQPNIYIEQNSNPPSSIPQPQEELKLVQIDPTEDSEGSKFYAPNTAIIFSFNKPINSEKIIVSVEPKILLSVKLENNSQDIFIQPAFPDNFKPDTVYTITIHKGTTALDGTTLNQDVNYRIKTRLQGGV